MGEERFPLSRGFSCGELIPLVSMPSLLQGPRGKPGLPGMPGSDGLPVSGPHPCPPQCAACKPQGGRLSSVCLLLEGGWKVTHRAGVGGGRRPWFLLCWLTGQFGLEECRDSWEVDKAQQLHSLPPPCRVTQGRKVPLEPKGTR